MVKGEGDLMPVISYDKKELIKMVKFSEKKVLNLIELMKMNIEEIDENNIKIEVTPDRVDLFGIEGLARALKSYAGIETGLKKFKVKNFEHEIKVENVKVRPFVACAIIRNLKMDERNFNSIIKLQEILHETVGRKRKKVAIGIHDLKKIKFPVYYTSTNKEAKFVPLDFERELTLKEILEVHPKGKEYGNIISKAKGFPVFVDSEGIISFPPIINSERTKITLESRDIFIDVTGTEKKAVSDCLNILVTSLAEKGCEIEAVKLKYEKKSEILPNLAENVVEVDKDLIKKVLGIELEDREIMSLLERMGFDCLITEKKIEVIVPAYRIDILHPYDIVEDVAIAFGYNNFVPELPKTFTIGRGLEIENISSKVRNILIGMGFQEVMNFVLSNEEDLFVKMNVELEDCVKLENPVSSEMTCLRTWLIPGLIKFLSYNKHYEHPQKIFEIGDVVKIDLKEESRTKTIRKFAGAIADNKIGFAEVKGIVDTLLKNLGLGYSLKINERSSYIKGRAAFVVINKKIVGEFGELHPKVLENYEMEMPIAVFEFNLENLKAGP